MAVDLPHLAFATAIAAWCIWYGIDAWRAQQTVANLIMIVPATIGGLILYLVVAFGCFHGLKAGQAEVLCERGKLEKGKGPKIAGTMAMLIAFVIVGPTVGFDVACLLYIGGMLLFLGERRLIPLILIPAIFCGLAIYCFSQILYTPLPLFFFGGDN
ncbi:MAG: tripartite tricarboxylate transporter TctB family protein [Rhizobiaceae bacterium]|nr:tripartite tricarboxylate transporter TctB family protein [Rhizobiaceae bacterium]